ncbi:MAG: hypothetical protein QF755_00285 [Candidatus Peribacteraceae bacterium]|jgi:hypothetical protein|nr:hypothetical protein [Candidatus Peribacteraceae bacterium]HCI03923.1 hypothetical protein [Candidatus Peribacteria bacterium]|tara:strand:+ start:7610 stop:8011 length:402 start_codon:yes stop_codon:yes gene_type:complete
MKCKNKHNVVVASLVGVIIGALIGAGTMQYAQLVAFKGADPNFMKDSVNVRSADGIFRERSDAGVFQVPGKEISEREARLRRAANAGHSAPLNLEDENEGCNRFTFGSPRYAKCTVEKRENDIDYQQWPSVPH